jgi:hypothetical protein
MVAPKSEAIGWKKRDVSSLIPNHVLFLVGPNKGIVRSRNAFHSGHSFNASANKRQKDSRIIPLG